MASPVPCSSNGILGKFYRLVEPYNNSPAYFLDVLMISLSRDLILLFSTSASDFAPLSFSSDDNEASSKENTKMVKTVLRTQRLNVGQT